MYPKDTEFKDHKIEKVEKCGEGWTITHDKCLCFFVPSDSPVEPKVGMTARFYGKGMGHPVRGLFIDGKKVYYRTTEEEKEYQAITLYGKDAQDWLDRWDAGKGVWSIEMGGIGPGYEQAIQITAAEILRHMLSENYDHSKWESTEGWKKDRDKIEKHSFENKTIKNFGLSGAQYGGALNLASNLFRMGPRKVMKDERVKDRHIQVSKYFPEG